MVIVMEKDVSNQAISWGKWFLYGLRCPKLSFLSASITGTQENNKFQKVLYLHYLLQHIYFTTVTNTKLQ